MVDNGSNLVASIFGAHSPSISVHHKLFPIQQFILDQQVKRQ